MTNPELLSPENFPEIGYDWITEQTNRTIAELSTTSEAERIADSISNLVNVCESIAPVVTGNGVFFREVPSDADQPVLYFSQKRNISADEARVIVDYNNIIGQEYLDNGMPRYTTSAYGYKVSVDAKFLAYTLKDNKGAGGEEIRIIDVESGSLLKTIEAQASPYFAWSNISGEHRFYITYGENHDTVVSMDMEGDGELRPEWNSKRFPWVDVDDADGRNIMILEYDTRSPSNDIYVKGQGQDEGQELQIYKGQTGRASAKIIGNHVYLNTVEGARKGRLMRKKVIIAEDGSMDVSSTTRAWESEGDVLDLQNWETVVPESEKGVLKDFVAFGDTLICLYDSGGYSKLRAMQGTQIVDIDLPEGFPTMAGLQIRPDYGQNVLYIKYESFAMPGSLLKIDFSNQSLDGPHLKIPIPEVVKQNTPDGFDRTQLSVEEVEYKQTEDGTPMTMLVIGYGERSANPKTVVEVYGGFNATLAPSYRPDIMNFIMEGGVYIVPKLHGDAGFYDARSKGPGKNRTVEDIKDATAFVQASLGTDARQTGLIGMSNGGLMAAITGLQRYPELFGAVVCESAPADLLNFVDKERYPNQDARYWPSEYGNDPEFLRTISPIHNIAIGQTHPPLLVITGDMDTNVSPKNGHQLAAMHIKANPSIPTYLFEQTGVGHSLLTKEQKRSRMTMRQQFFNKMLA